MSPIHPGAARVTHDPRPAPRSRAIRLLSSALMIAGIVLSAPSSQAGTTCTAGVQQEFYSSGKLLRKSEVLNCSDGTVLFHGKSTVYFENGKKSEEQYFSNDVLTGLSQTWTDQGKLTLSLTYISGLPEGLTMSFYTTGKLQSQGYMKAGKKEGYWITFHANGMIESQGAYQADKKVGTWVYVSSDATKVYTVEENGQSG